MITVVPTDRIYLCCGETDMRRYAVHKIMSSPERQREGRSGCTFCHSA